MQIKVARRYHSSSIRWTNTKKMPNCSCHWGCGRWEWVALSSAWVGINSYSCFGELERIDLPIQKYNFWDVILARMHLFQMFKGVLLLGKKEQLKTTAVPRQQGMDKTVRPSSILSNYMPVQKNQHLSLGRWRATLTAKREDPAQGKV